MVGMLFNNILYCFSNIYIISYLLDFIIGNSITTTFLLYVCSYVFGFCKWHRFIITANIINLLIANLDAYYRIPISDIQLLIVYHFVAALFICISTYIHIKNNRDERKIIKLLNLLLLFILKMKILVVLKLGITLKQLIEFILDLLLRQYVFLNMLPLLLFIYLIQKIYYFSLFFFN